MGFWFVDPIRGKTFGGTSPGGAMFLRTRDEPNRLQRAGRTAREAVRSASENKPLALRLLVVPVAVGAVVWVVRAVRTRSAAGEEATADESSPDGQHENRADKRARVAS
jgi:hypothetical protein